MLSFAIIGVIIFSIFATKSAYKTFYDLISLLFAKVITYFDITPIGQILNLTSQDSGKIDFIIFLFLFTCLNYSIPFLYTFLVTAVNNLMIIPFIFMFCFLSVY